MEATKHFASLCGITKEVKKSLLELKLKEMLLSTKIKFNNNQVVEVIKYRYDS